MLPAPVKADHRLEYLFPQNLCALAINNGGTGLSGLFAEEFELVKNAIPKRQHEFAAGRLLARQAMSQLGMAPGCILQDSLGAPLWCQGSIGSISHTQNLVVAVVAHRQFIRGLGVDVESMQTGFPWPAIGSIAVPKEQAWLRTLPEASREIAAYCLFSAKESVIKCLSSLGLPLLFFSQFSLQLDLALGQFWVSGINAFPVFGTPVAGRLAWDKQHVFTSAWCLEES